MRGNKRLQRIGSVLHLGSNRNLILKAKNPPKIGDKVVDKDLRRVGVVFDISGPTSSPYVTVKPEITDPHNLVNQVLYAVPSRRLKMEKKRCVKKNLHNH